MVVGIGTGNAGNVLLIGLDESQVQDLQAGLTVNFERGTFPPFTDIVVIYGKTRDDIIKQLEAANVAFSPEMREKYVNNERTDNPRKTN